MTTPLKRYCDLTKAELNHLDFCDRWHEGLGCLGPTNEDWDRYYQILQSIGISCAGDPLEPEPDPSLPWNLPHKKAAS